MISAGNDIVALNSVDSRRTNQFAFYSKILSTSEQSLYNLPQCSVIPFEHYVWLLWSIKESAFKYLKRSYPALIFSPIKIIVDEIELFAGENIELPNQKLFKGKLSYQHQKLFFTSQIAAEWIASVVNNNKSFEDICWQVEQIDGDSYKIQSNAARSLLLKKLNAFLPGDLAIGKNPVGYPEIIQDHQKIAIPVSIAHHGFFISYAFNLSGFQKIIA